MIKLLRWVGISLRIIKSEDDSFETKAKPIGSISARIFRADGKVEDLGVISKGKVSKGIIQPEGK